MSTGSVQGPISVEHRIEGLSFDIRFYTVNHPELFFVVKVGFKPFQNLSFKTKAIAQSI